MSQIDYLVSSKNGFVEMQQQSVESSPLPRRSQTIGAELFKRTISPENVSNIPKPDEDHVLYHIRESVEFGEMTVNFRESCGVDSLLLEHMGGIEGMMGRASWAERPSIDPSFFERASVTNLLEFPIKFDRPDISSSNRLNVSNGHRPIFLSADLPSPKVEIAIPSHLESPKITMAGLPCPSVAIQKSKKTAVPKAKDLDGFADENMLPMDQWTSVMIRNIPCRYTQEELVEEITMHGFIVDFLYLPPARRTVGNLGYCFVNFVEPVQAANFLKVFQGYAFTLQPKSKKRAQVLYAKLQGFEKNVEFYQGVKVMKSKYQPYIDHDAHLVYQCS